MLTNQEIEDQETCINTVADLKLRFDIAKQALELVIEAIRHEQPHKAYEIACNDLARATGEHDSSCNKQVVIRASTGEYECNCMLITQPEEGENE